jgi:hypothetical protein
MAGNARNGVPGRLQAVAAQARVLLLSPGYFELEVLG